MGFAGACGSVRLADKRVLVGFVDFNRHWDGGERYCDGGDNVPEAEEEHDQMIRGHGQGG